MINRWTILGVLFFARLTMGMQFQSVAALSPLIIDAYAVTLADIGLMIGLYLGPGILIALPGGTIATFIGDKRTCALALALMLTGGLMIAFMPGWEAALAGRVLAGIGGVIINVVMTKMLVDWFAGREIATALAFFITSWPAGIAFALLALPHIALAGGLIAAWIAVSGVITLALSAFLIIYRPPSEGMTAATPMPRTALPVGPLITAGALWGLYNVALGMLFAFGPVVLEARGLGLTSASTLVGYLIIAVGITTPLGGILSDKSGRRDLVILGGLLLALLLMPALLFGPPGATTALYLLTGLAFGIAAGPIMAIPSTLLLPEARAFGMGVFFTIYYALMMIGPALAGWVADRTGQPEVVYWLGVATLLVCLGLLGLLRRMRQG